MTSRIDVRAPATITVLGGTNSLSSLGALPPGGISVNDPANGTLTIQLVAADSGTFLAASGAGGATIGGSGNTLSITGNTAQVNAALATLLITEPSGATTDTIQLSATDPGALPAQTDIAVNVAQNLRPAFVNPPTTINLAPNTISALPGLFAADPGAAGAALAGEGAAQTLVLTLAASSGLLLLPGYSPTDGIEATGLATGTIELTFTADRLASVDSLIAGLEIAAPSASSGIAYSLRDASDPDRVSVTNGNIALHVAGTAGPNGSFSSGDQSVILGAESLAAGQTLSIATTTGDLGGIAGAAALHVAPDTAFNLPYNNLTLGSSSHDVGTLAASGFGEAGAIVIAERDLGASVRIT